MTIYDYGDDVRLTATFTDAAGDAQDPTACAILVQKPDLSELSYKSSSGFASQGAWDASANTPTLANGTGTAGHFYTVSAAGSVDFGDGSITFTTSDQVAYNGDIWLKLPGVSTSALTKSATGIYYIDQAISQTGTWNYSCLGLGTGMAGASATLRVKYTEF